MAVKSVNLAPDVLLWLEQNSHGNVSGLVNELVRNHFSKKASSFGSLKATRVTSSDIREKKDRSDAW